MALPSAPFARSNPAPWRASAIDSRKRFAARHVDIGRKTELAALFAVQARANGTFPETIVITIAYDEFFAPVACYLCNTHPKRV
jgi:hypothetical protein